MEEDKEIQAAKTYIGTKVIKALPMTEACFFIEKDGAAPDREDQPGYKVTYPDGYVSWSPKHVFEKAYREVSDEEKSLI